MQTQIPDHRNQRHERAPTAPGMRREVYEAVAHRLLEHARQGTTDQLPAIKAVPVSAYRDRTRWEAEIRHVFHSLPLLVALSCELRGAGAYKACEVAGVPILVTRGDDRRVRAFLNVCRHRGAHVAEPGHGCRSRFTCPYHGWSYGSDGKLIAIADAARFGELDTAQHGLVELHTREVAGLVFTCLTPGRHFDLETFLGEMLDELASYQLESWTLVAQNVIEGPNWKIAMDGYIEFYHIAALHPKTLAGMVTNNTMACDVFGRHAFGPHQRIAAPSSDILAHADKPIAEWQTGEAMLDVKFLFPNNSFAITSGNALSPPGGMLSQIFPGPTPDTSVTVQNHIYQDVPDSGPSREAIDAAIERFGYVVREEDYRGGRQIQRGLATNANEAFVFGRNEIGPQNFHTALDHYIARGGA